MRNNILVVGNGFDIAHGLNTQYIEFIEFCFLIRGITYSEGDEINNLMFELDEKKSSSYSFEASVYRKIRNYYANKNLIKERKQFVSKCKNNFWLKFVSENKESIGEGWSSLETIIGNMVEAHSFIVNNLQDITVESSFRYKKNHKDIEIIYNLLKNQENQDYHIRLTLLKDEMEKGLDDLTWLLEIYIYRFLNDKRKKLELFDSIKFRYLISFNYTSTYNKIYKKRIDTHFIHGYADANREIEHNNMVFGIGKRIQNIDIINQHDYLGFQKFYQRIIKKTGVKYQSWIDLEKNDSKAFANGCNVFVYGHSLDYSDGDIIKDLMNSNKSKFIIFYKDIISFKNLVVNLIKIFSEDEVIEFTNIGKIHFVESNDLETVKRLCNEFEGKEQNE